MPFSFATPEINPNYAAILQGANIEDLLRYKTEWLNYVSEPCDTRVHSIVHLHLLAISEVLTKKVGTKN